MDQNISLLGILIHEKDGEQNTSLLVENAVNAGLCCSVLNGQSADVPEDAVVG